ncbi:hypothetical protein ACFZCL_32200 [Streptomyces sp. NPDC008159]|uniref:DUF7848 domain-containing protein n=1 Tax=Streptomyces sp. NPDC008159 TaxID=3364817 RepID=UPI0036EDB199
MRRREEGELGRPPVPVPGCAACAELAARRDEARARYDGSAETDANVLLRHHQRRDHGGAARTRRIFRYVPYVLAQDQTAEPEYEARCVSGDETECGAGSGVRSGPADVEEWLRGHTQETGHRRYRRTFGDYAVFEAQEDVPREGTTP